MPFLLFLLQVTGWGPAHVSCIELSAVCEFSQSIHLLKAYYVQVVGTEEMAVNRTKILGLGELTCLWEGVAGNTCYESGQYTDCREVGSVKEHEGE